ncbi:MAG: hypothetical protein KAR47_01460 [Planctomycetes bacterium]|nr:hypothetical protein [Planctomycetota bacterium]
MLSSRGTPSNFKPPPIANSTAKRAPGISNDITNGANSLQKQQQDNPWGQGLHGGGKDTEQFKEEQQTRLKADLSALAAGVKKPQALADIQYGHGWQQEVDKYRKEKELRDAIAIASMVSTLAGFIMLAGYAVKRFAKARADRSEASKADSNDMTDQAQDEPEAGIEAGIETDTGAKTKTKAKNKSKSKGKGKNKTVTTANTATEQEMEVISQQSPDQSDSDVGQSDPDAGQFAGEHLPQESAVASEDGPGPGSSAGYFQSLGMQQDKSGATAVMEKSGSTAVKKLLSGRGGGLENLGGKVAQASSDLQVDTLMSTEPVRQDDLSELTQEVSAIREFAAQQQDRVRQLQDGYDWGIIKRFCIRVIRCIDNLDDRIKKLCEEGLETEYMEDVRDELVFSLESSGVEQFEPELGSDYRGQEKLAEAVRTREPADTPDLTGKIAEIVRPGYKYVVSDEDMKIVRSSRVKLYG